MNPRSAYGADRRDRRGVWLAVVGLVVLLGGLYVAGHFLLGNRLPTGTRIGGIGVGGLTPAEAEERLEADLGPHTGKTLRFYFEEHEFDIEPNDVGLDLRVDESVAAAGGGRTWNPVRMLETTVGADRISPVVDVDQKRLDARIDDVVERVDVAPVEPRVRFEAGEMRVRRPEAGRAVQRDEVEELVRERFVRDREPIPLPVEVDRPEVTAGEFDRALDERVRVAVGAPLTLRAGGRSFTLSRDEVKSMLGYDSRDGRLAATIDEKRFADLVAAKTEDLRRPARPATVVIRNGSPKAVADRPGRRVQTGGTASAVIRALESRQAKKRVVGLEVTRTRSDFRKADARKLGIRARIGSYVARYPVRKFRRQRSAVSRVNGTLLRPGDTFSLNGVVGGNSFGDITPLATAVFNAGLRAGMKNVERHSGKVYADHFPAGLDAVAYPGTSLRFANDSKHGVLVRVWLESGRRGAAQVHAELWSTKRWTVKLDAGKRQRVRKPVRVKRGRACKPRPGVPGFAIEVRRTFHRDGKKVRGDSVTSSYQPRPRIRCRRR